MNILFISNIDMRGSGYLRISLPLLDELSKHEDMNIKLLGYQYKGEEHYHPYSIIPVPRMENAVQMVVRINQLMHVDWVVIALDIPNITSISSAIRNNTKNIKIAGIFPVESDPMNITWGNQIAALDAAFCISKFGTTMCQEYMPETHWLPMGMDPQFYPVDKKEAREQHLIPEEDFTILTVADNQERKNLSAAMNVVDKFARKADAPVTYILVTREKLQVGWDLRDYWEELNSNVNLMIMERGLPDEELNALYNAADVFFISSKAEGWCMPIAEAISTNTPIVGGDHSGIKEQVELSRYGILVPAKFIHRDVWQNARRYYIDEDKAASALMKVFMGKQFNIDHRYKDQLTWENSAKVLYGALNNGEN